MFYNKKFLIFFKNYAAVYKFLLWRQIHIFFRIFTTKLNGLSKKYIAVYTFSIWRSFDMFDSCCRENAPFSRNFADTIFGGHALSQLHKKFLIAVNHKKKVLGPCTILSLTETDFY